MNDLICGDCGAVFKPLYVFCGASRQSCPKCGKMNYTILHLPINKSLVPPEYSKMNFRCLNCDGQFETAHTAYGFPLGRCPYCQGCRFERLAIINDYILSWVIKNSVGNPIGIVILDTYNTVPHPSTDRFPNGFYRVDIRAEDVVKIPIKFLKGSQNDSSS